MLSMFLSEMQFSSLSSSFNLRFGHIFLVFVFVVSCTFCQEIAFWSIQSSGMGEACLKFELVPMTLVKLSTRSGFPDQASRLKSVTVELIMYYCGD